MDEAKKEYPAVKARTKGKKQAFLALIAKNGLIEVACQKIGVSRQTYYRWRKEDRKFGDEADVAMRHGSETTDDLVESKFMKLIHDEDRHAILFYLKYRHAKYSDRAAIRRMVLEQVEDESALTEDEERRIDAALNNIREYQAREEEKIEAYMASQVPSAASSPQQPLEG
jgi:hypothetical protein